MRDTLEAENWDLKDDVSEMEHRQLLMNADMLELRAKLISFDAVSAPGFGDTTRRRDDDGNQGRDGMKIARTTTE